MLKNILSVYMDIEIQKKQRQSNSTLAESEFSSALFSEQGGVAVTLY
jgi:hypothetical protein